MGLAGLWVGGLGLWVTATTAVVVPLLRRTGQDTDDDEGGDEGWLALLLLPMPAACTYDKAASVRDHGTAHQPRKLPSRRPDWTGRGGRPV